MKRTLLALVLITFSFHRMLVADHTEQLGNLVGEGLALYYTDHAISGHVKGSLVFATPVEEGFGLRLLQRSKGKTVESVLTKKENGFSGTIQGTAITIQKVTPAEGTIEGTIGEDPFKVLVSADKMEGNHYVNPRFEVVLKDRTYNFHLDNGLACMGCAVKITWAVLGMLHSTGGL